MKIHKRVTIALLLLLIILAVFLTYVIYRYNYPCPRNFYDSKWVCEGEFGKIELNIGSDGRSSLGVLYSQNDKTYMDFGFDSSTKSVFIVEITENEYFGKREYFNMSQLVLRGTYRCTEEKFVITSFHYNPLFGDENLNPMSDEKTQKLKLVFERVE